MRRYFLESLRRWADSVRRPCAWADAVSRRCTQKLDHDDFVARYGRNGNYVGTAILFVCFATSTLGCRGDLRVARTALDVSARGLHVADLVVRTAYRARAVTARTESANWDEYDTRMAAMNRTESALLSVSAMLYAAEAAVDARELDGILVKLGCLRDSLTLLVEALQEAEVEWRGLDAVQAALSRLPLGSCQESAQ